ncbi:Glycoprotease family protein [Ophiocordyceps sinensis CO18]|uniref:Glycoprotease family protein n=1 Tax=Ophiocordyceps sinensis (strain Co18 / CGMCC 3.14243) TaxID=911162 RepID=T5AJV4_OPHSC|nr:Glycoprotease family protein [Ophiocordyceps sinensis CO18]
MEGSDPAMRAHPATSHLHTVEDWEDWEDDHVISPIDAVEPQVIQTPPPVYSRERAPAKSLASRASRQSSAKVKRLRSRRRQKAQNAKAGIKLVTDMAAFKRGNHVAHQARPADSRPIKFVDAAALRALEGKQSSASVGNWNWLKSDGSQSPDCPHPNQHAATPTQELSPEDRPIVIGISLPPDHVTSPEASTQQAGVDNSKAQKPAQTEAVAANDAGAPSQHPPDVNAGIHRSVWSPDTPDTIGSFNYFRATSSVYSRAFTSGHMGGEKTPPVPALPASYQRTPQQGPTGAELGGTSQSEDDSGTPCTLFEEDGNSPPHKQVLTKEIYMSPDSATSRSQGWWDHVVTPFLDKSLSFSSRKMKADSPGPETRSPSNCYGTTENCDGRPTTRYLLPVQAPIVRKPTLPKCPSPSPSMQAPETPRNASTQQSATQQSATQQSATQQSATQQSANTVARGAPAKSDVSAAGDIRRDQPPPYSPPKKQLAAPVRYRAVFPPQHPLHSQFPPSPCPASPGLAATMTSQGATQMTDIPLTPTIQTRARSSLRIPLPVRPLGSYAPQDRGTAATGRTRKVERQRRRHEKEEVVARRLGGFWRGRGCVPASGCFGRTGREGRQRRRVWLVLWAGIISLMILIIVLALVLARRHNEAPREAPSIWVNLTDFPPMPTGVLTVVGPDNSVSRSACTEPSTLWSCSLPKDQHDTVAPYKANQPTVVMHIQWDNSSQDMRRPPEAVRRGTVAASWARGVLGRRQTTPSFTPEPGAPDREEMRFLGNTTDGIQSEYKAGEPTPFYISLLKSAHEPVKGSVLSRREPGTRVGNESLEKLLPSPDLEANGTPAPAVMIPSPAQQPVRLFDRGLPTEHYGFYTHFKRSLFLKSVTILNKTEAANIPLDEGGGCRKNEANHLVTWGETRVLVQIWTRTLGLNTSSLLRPDESRGIGGTGELIRPGTMPYPVTVTLDTHGGDPIKKLVWNWPLDKRQSVGVDKAQLLANNMGVGGTWINPRGTGDRKMGGFDGGSGGCRCEWVNWVNRAS